MTREEVFAAFGVPGHITKQLEPVEVPEGFKSITISIGHDRTAYAIAKTGDQPRI